MASKAAQRKRWDYMRSVGKPGRILPHEFAQLQAHMRALTDAGMTHQLITEIAGCPTATLSRILSPKAAGATRRNYEKLMAVEFALPDQRGARVVETVGLQRRVNALRAAGWGIEAQNRILGCLGSTRLRNISKGRAHLVHFNGAQALKAMYDKLKDVDPIQYGIPPADVKRTKAYAKDLAPPACWDDDTIDDPDAYPEWTGACGTFDGYRVHVREDIPLCAVCKSAVEDADEVMVRVLDAPELRARLKSRDVKLAQLAEAVGVAVDTVFRWSMGDREPKSLTQVEGVAAYIGCDTEDITKLVARPGFGSVKPGDLNPHILCIAIDQAGLSRSDVAQAAGIASSTLTNYCTGRHKHPAAETVQKLAAAVGKDPKALFQ